MDSRDFGDVGTDCNLDDCFWSYRIHPCKYQPYDESDRLRYFGRGRLLCKKISEGQIAFPKYGILGQGVEASGHEPVRKLWTTEGELVSSRESLLAIGGMRAGT